MSFLCDTTVLFAASDTAHEHHEPSLELVASAKPGEAFVAAHSLAELYATLSGMPAPRMRRLAAVLEAVEHAAGVFTPVSLEPEDHLWVIRHLASAGARSGKVYDALILKCGERAGVERVYTWNTRDFLAVSWPDMAGTIRTP